MDGMTARITNATPSELLVITYEITIDSIDHAIRSLKEENENQFKRYIYKTQSLIKELMNTLNMKYQISLELMSLYLFANKALIKAYAKKDSKELYDAKKVLNILKDGWSTLSDADTEGKRPVISNAQKLVAGLTYGRGMLNESVTNNGSNRGFTA